MTSFTNGVELIDPRCLLGEHEKAAPAIGCRPFAFLHIGTICLEVRIRSAALIFLARHKTAILGATLLAGGGVAARGQAASLSTRGSWPWGGKSPLAALVWIARPPCWRSPGAPAARLLALCPEPPLFSCGEDQLLLIYQGHLEDVFNPYIKYFANIFSWTSNPAG